MGKALASDVVADRLDERLEAGRGFFAAQAAAIARLCHGMAERFARGGRLIALGESPAERSDARHVAVEFVHPVIVGKRALPAIGLAPEGGDVHMQLGLIAEPDDIVMAFGAGAALSEAERRGWRPCATRWRSATSTAGGCSRSAMSQTPATSPSSSSIR